MEPAIEPVEPASPGSIADIVARLALWARRAPKGLARVEFDSEFARQEVLRRLRHQFTMEEIPVSEIDLPGDLSPVEATRYLVDRLRTSRKGVVSVSGFPVAFPLGPGIADALRVLNTNRENLAVPSLRQIWWMPPAFAEEFLRIVPDLDSWFLVRLRLREVVFRPASAILPSIADRTPIALHEARQQADRLVRRFEHNVAAGGALAESIALARSAVEPLFQEGAVSEARGLAEHLLDALSSPDSAALIKALERELDPNQINSANRFEDLGFLFNVAGRASEAELLYRRAIKVRERLLGPDHPDTAISLNNLANLLHTRGRYSEAESLYRQALEVRQRVLGPDHSDTAISLNNLAGALYGQGRYAEAEPLCRQALEVRERVLGPDHPDTTISLNNLANLLYEQGRYAEAEPLYRQALEVRERVLGPDHPDITISLNNLAGALYGQGRFSEAEPLYRQALEVRQRLLGPDHPDTAMSLNNLAGLLFARGRYTEAEPLYRRALEVRQRVLGSNHPHTNISLDNLAGLLRARGRLSEARAIEQSRGEKTAVTPPPPASGLAR